MIIFMMVFNLLKYIDIDEFKREPMFVNCVFSICGVDGLMFCPEHLLCELCIWLMLSD